MLFTRPAMADGFYAGASLGISKVDNIANAEKVALCEPLCFDDEISVNGIHFDANESAWGLVFGWKMRDWLAFEASYSELGEPAEFVSLPVVTATTPLIVPVIPPDLPPPTGVIDVGYSPLGAGSNNFGSYAALSIKEIALSAKFSKRLADRYSAYWILGISRADFEASGSLRIPVLAGFGQGPIEFSVSPFATPDATTGTVWGFGFAWDANERFSLDVGYRRHDTRVIDVETVTLRAIAVIFE